MILSVPQGVDIVGFLFVFQKEIKEIEDTSTNIHCQRFFTKEKGERVGVKCKFNQILYYKYP